MLYDYKCNNCGTILRDVYRSIKEQPMTLCQVCGQNSLESIIFGGIHAIVEQEPKTLNQQAVKNTKNMGHYERQDREAEKKLRTKEVQMELNRLGSLSESDKKKYING